MNETIGVRPRPSFLDDACNDLAVEISLEMKRKNLRLADVRRKAGISKRHSDTLSAFLRGVDDARFGLRAALRVAEALDIPVAIRVGDEARELTA